jgi:hypothetical protein
MTPKPQRFVVYVYISAMETGIWCEVCLLPSGRAFETTPMNMHGVGRTRRFSGCPECGTPTTPTAT